MSDNLHVLLNSECSNTVPSNQVVYFASISYNHDDFLFYLLIISLVYYYGFYILSNLTIKSVVKFSLEHNIHMFLCKYLDSSSICSNFASFHLKMNCLGMPIKICFLRKVQKSYNFFLFFKRQYFFNLIFSIKLLF